MPPENTDIDMSKHVETLFEGVSGVTDDHRAQMAVILESATNDILNEERVQMQAAAEEYANYLADNAMASLKESFDAYSEYAMNTWIEDNKIALEGGLKVERADKLIDGITTLLAEQNIKVDEQDSDILQAHINEIASLKDNLNTTINENIELTSKISDSVRGVLISENSNGLTETQKEKFETLVESFDHTDVANFNSKCELIKNTYFNKMLNEEVELPQTQQQTQPQSHIDRILNPYN